MYWLADGTVGKVLNVMFNFSMEVGYCPYVTSVCAVEGCGLLADGQACKQLSTRGYAVTVRTLQVLPVPGSPH